MARIFSTVEPLTSSYLKPNSIDIFTVGERHRTNSSSMKAMLEGDYVGFVGYLQSEMIEGANSLITCRESLMLASIASAPLLEKKY